MPGLASSWHALFVQKKMSNTLIETRIECVRSEAEGVKSYELRPVAVGELPPFTAGAHVDVHLQNGMVRSYSLSNSQDERHRYVVSVALDRSSRGGSRFLHDAMSEGDRLTISPPRNNFQLMEMAPHSVLIAGGIGIVPLWSMVQRLHSLNRSWELHYCARTRNMAAFREELSSLHGVARGRVRFNFDGEPGGVMLDLGALLRGADPLPHYYCCGPAPMLEAFEAAAASLPRDHVHVEYFASREAPATTGGYTVVLARSGRTIEIPPGKTILETLLALGMDVPFACEMGTCATCETRVLEGVPDHRDVVLSPEERESNQVMMICCSGCKSDRLVIDR